MISIENLPSGFSIKAESMFIFGVAVFLLTIGLPPEFHSAEARFFLFAQEMLRNGPTFFPTTYGAPYPDYTATSTFLIYLVSLPLGKVTPFSAVLPSAIAAALILVMVFRIGAIHSRELGLWAVLLCFFTTAFFSMSRGISPDLYTSLVTIACFYLIYLADISGRKGRLRLLPLLFMIGFIFRGPIGLVVPAGVVCAYYLIEKDFKTLLLTGAAAVTVLGIGLACLLAAAKFQGGESFVQDVITWQVTSRLPASAVSAEGFGYYWYHALDRYAVSYPLAILAVFGYIQEIWRPQNKKHKFLVHLLGWILIVLGGLSIPGVKKMRYILPAAPAFALLAAHLFIDLQPGKWLARIREGFLWLCRYLPVLTGISCLAALLFWQKMDFGFEPRLFPAVFLMGTIVIALRIILRRLEEKQWKDMARLAAATLTFIVLSICFVEPASYSRTRSEPFVKKIETLLQQKPGILVFYRQEKDSSAIRFLSIIDKPMQLEFVDSYEEMEKFRTNGYFVLEEKYLNSVPYNKELQVHVLERGCLAGDVYVLFTFSTDTNRKPPGQFGS